MNVEAFAKNNRAVDLRCGHIAYHDEGIGPVILFLHGCPFSSYVWRTVIPELSSTFRCIAPDLLGLGDTETASDADWSLPAQARMVIDLLDHLGLERIHVVGHDHGGAVAQLLAAHHPERIERLVLADVEAFDNWPSHDERPFIIATQLPAIGRLVLWLWSFPALARLALSAGAAVSDKRALTADMVNGFVAANLGDRHRRAKTRRFLAGQLEAHNNRCTVDLLEKLRGFEQSTMIVWGEADPHFGPEWGQRLYDEIPGAVRLELLPNTGHLLMEERPKRFAALLREFLTAATPIGRTRGAQPEASQDGGPGKDATSGSPAMRGAIVGLRSDDDRAGMATQAQPRSASSSEACRLASSAAAEPSSALTDVILDRRRALLLGAGLLTGCALRRTPAQARFRAPSGARFAVPLPIPPVMRPVRSDAAGDYYEVVQREAQVEIFPGCPTTVWGYDGLLPGPTIKARWGRTVVVQHTNRLSVPTVVHLHGGVTPPDSDGFPTDMVMPGESKSYTYPNDQRAATLWYHDHVMHHTARNLYMGLSGLYVVEDDEEAALRLPHDVYDIPLVIQSKLFTQDGALVYDAGFGGVRGAKTNTLLVNGAPWPHLEVAARKYRFRILNASNATPLRLALSSGQPLLQIATDGGLLPSPVASRTIPLAMAERIEVVIDFAAYDVGATIVLQNLRESGALGEIMRFDVVRHERDDSDVPERLCAIEPLDAQRAVRTRRFVFNGSDAFAMPPLVWTINGRDFNPDEPIAEPRCDDVEIWHLINRKAYFVLGMLHPIHVHLVSFQLLDRNGIRASPHEGGWKDTLALERGEEARVIARFGPYRGRYLVHCHNLEHEDHAMMARFDIV